MNSSKTYQLNHIAQIVGGTLIGDDDFQIDRLSIDSRTLVLASKTLFFALVGERHNGHDYIQDLYDKGIRAFVVSENINQGLFGDCNFIVVTDTLNALQKLCAHHRKNFTYPVIAITGSNGKTIVKEWLYQVLNPHYRIVRSPKSYNSQVGVPISVWQMNLEDEFAIFEAGISKPCEMDKLETIIQATGGIFTHLGSAHLENFDDTKSLLDEKLKLFASCEWIVYCSDDIRVSDAIKERYAHQKVLLNWSRNTDSKLQIISEKLDKGKIELKAVYNGEEKTILLPFIDKASIENAINCWLTFLHLGLSDEHIYKGFCDLEAVAMRLEIKEGQNNCLLINDYYNSDLGSLSIALDLMNQQGKERKKTVILSDIFQSGFEPRDLYEQVSELLTLNEIDKIVGIGDNIASQAKNFQCESVFYSTTEIFLNTLDPNGFKNEIILIRGARDFRFERISSALQYKAHRTILEVNLTAMVHNLNYFRSLLQPNTKLMVMVKAFSYGSGSTEIANLLQYHHVDYLAVAIADEGVDLRTNGISTPIVVMNPELHSFETMIDYNLEPEIYCLSVLKSFESILKRSGLKNYPIHLKLDTGMFRMGFVDHELDELINYLKVNPYFHIRSVFSHLAGSDEEIHDDYTESQIAKFEDWSKQIRTAFAYEIDRHILNTSGIERFPNAQFEMVRLGIGLYGVSATKQNMLMNVSSLKTTISQIKWVEKDQTVGYSRKGKLNKKSRIGIIPIGYADGFNRKLSNGVGQVLVNGNLVSVVGNVCMDMCMIDLTDIEAEEGDSVIIFGDDYSLSRIAEKLDTIPYEILTTVSRRVKRIYFQE
ncbi:bifunctional UDP-N-acetylmuramoyl-tripeptide:D-alanyl-D-alanine ligase/alanine racemase [Ancylomarina euxinus]|uniref:Alanine racemase n=1 Tax=Ancylomarina euxinus TaxID=2283627 RepID=A0A425Y5E4_9BACT|nr:bifunctional UDP-N-acetylmuramoyl-tripeptide:D-alanyl-D-alanine ligase/alanine racemase [Ancylomarina euxinus]MCZ4694427.1 bifunctional UDP-N-acetylmuramoyl-tripeptide:D-alanyl-D-alanine ligase/alanine racemase [Ancylomarina euxinus]MUP16673.1 bifunctional UDP-N-acetylmuramoyl-tripeptide:D-alanyl-D-alanine ligase/alanine racemase [Ancylomarina euxinus]RRG23564.1 bifunctional UDP-N-acetylmuramoyl-tripeptide:D-alanyl-D-alanine ligase/alanine racemase [Ancylomarina euxinus]